jgi:hypothetical protein
LRDNGRNMAEVISKDEISQFLDCNSVQDKYYIETKDFFTNHLGHGAIALYYLGVNANQLEAYRKKASEKLQPTDGTLFQKHQTALEGKDKV